MELSTKSVSNQEGIYFVKSFKNTKMENPPKEVAFNCIITCSMVVVFISSQIGKAPQAGRAFRQPIGFQLPTTVTDAMDKNNPH